MGNKEHLCRVCGNSWIDREKIRVCPQCSSSNLRITEFDESTEENSCPDNEPSTS